MSNSCTHCDKYVRPRQEALQCKQCQRWHHRTCSGITREKYRQTVKGTLQLDWICCQCQKETDEPDNSIVVDVPFNVPEPVVDSSILQDPLQDVAPDLNPLKRYYIIDDGSTRGKRKLVDTDGFSYTVKKQTGDHILWRCSKRSKTLTCPATVIWDGDTYRLGLKIHVHPGEPGSHIAIKIKAEVKKKTKENVYGIPTSFIVQEVLRQHADPTAPPASRPNTPSLVRTGNRQRLGTHPAARSQDMFKVR